MKGCMSTDLGIITIDPEVIAKYAGTVAVECFGIVGMAAVNMKDGLVHLLKKENRMAADMDDTLIHIISNTIFTGIFEIIAHDDNANDAEKHINALYDFYTAGWYEILGIR